MSKDFNYVKELKYISSSLQLHHMNFNKSSNFLNHEPHISIFTALIETVFVIVALNIWNFFLEISCLSVARATRGESATSIRYKTGLL